MPVDLNDELSPIDPDNDKYTEMLANLQGNILKSHGRDHAIHLFLNFTADAQAVKNWISAFTKRYITSALRQHYETKEFKINGVSGHIFAGFYLSAEGYRALGYNDLEVFKEFEDSDVENGGLPTVYFKYGMERCQPFLRDPDPSEWEEAYRGRQVHALVLLADRDEKRLTDVAARVKESLTGVAEILASESGFVERDELKRPIEHFGYRDGISQPLFFKSEIDETPKKEFWNPSAALKLVLTRDPHAGEGDHFGSYLVFRKLEQDVAGFNEAVGKLALEIGIPDNETLAGAMAVGRFKNGTPVIMSGTHESGEAVGANDFIYTDVETGHTNFHKCPLHAHIRKSNPRGDTGIVDGKINDFELNRRIARRGIPYTETAADNPQSKKVGLLFLCFQSSIPRQFGFIQTGWVNTPSFFEEGVGIDPLIGKFIPEEEDDADEGIQQWCTEWGGSEDKKAFSLANFVHMKGGIFFRPEYFISQQIK